VKATESVPLLGVIDVTVGAAGVWATSTEVSVGAVKVRGERALVARSAIAPLLRSRVVETAMPSVSNSPLAVATVYLNVAVLESVSETNVAYLVSAPTVSVRRGLPVTVTDSEKFTVKLSAPAGIYVAFEGADTEEIVGAVRSITTVFAELTVGGPVEVPVTEFAFSCRMTVPSVQLVRVTV
jgi:hypothetical protein